ncbi:hypothetical protein A3A70_00130 [candidate division WWE3 bacterium RIFCSPLOWO2_01_FULL_42_11]|uniref:LysM domain-containing protein n=1 Tax=candidate division WWE3 bacterium RIFCSPLOWO2_01_FULL_42_11 TaxID=1802627 RepID=A0A1F4VME6_UNCKA|nr:MAG: hypothetical protein A3A70_00130 [candidate division WWE3 bacterium RIFCSPLOWO2_01_FULL_42_11]
MKTPHLDHPIPSNLRVAMLVTKVPSEPLTLLKQTLSGMLEQTYPHDTWVADEDPTPESLKWYQENGVRVSCRKDETDYHNDFWPRRMKCKEGNLAYFYDKFGYENYDVVVQLDADHQPTPGYLEHMLRPFSDPKVAYVAAPSIGDRNKNFWATRARAQAGAVFHGPIQSGANDGWIPTCIGSHYALRTKALKEVGGIGPELAEDYSTTLALNSGGWSGVWSYNAEAHGDGPHTYADLITQDYQWARSLITLFLSYYPKHMSKLSFKHKLHFAFTQLWYPLGAMVWLVSVSLPIVALVTGIPPVSVKFSEFVMFAGAPLALSFLIFEYARNKKHLRPKDVKFFSWENALFELGRWPWILIACIDGVISTAFGRKHTFRVTPKNNRTEMIPARVLMPYFLLVIVNLLAIFFRQDGGALKGYFWFSFVIAMAYLALLISVVTLHLHEAQNKSQKFVLRHAPQFISSVFLGILLLVATPSQLNSITDARNPQTIKPPIDSTPTSNSKSYTIQYGDTLWSVSKTFYGDGSKWSQIHVLDDANRIHPGTVVEIPPKP